MLQRGRKKRAWFAKSSFVQATAAALPFSEQSVDVVFANLLLPWVDDPNQVFSEIARVLRKGGVFAFATLGPDSLLEIRRAWSDVDNNEHVNRFLDMHDLGDGLVNAGFADPVLDVDRLSISYDSVEKLFADLTAMGGRNALQQRNHSLVGKRQFRQMTESLRSSGTDGKITLDLELVFGHCWGAGPKMDATNYRIDADTIPRRKT
jgi:malonyl-CoA O-methyltransferase